MMRPAANAPTKAGDADLTEIGIDRDLANTTPCAWNEFD